ncbi:FecR family protein [Pseudoflavitalea rhizosphaerae]|uniref:FecR family protein n=1 Tax=Pseudoflavitalea rhizosphaerae TaxID=1884793 RepID=UPI000F8E74AF|nr:FecR family protein [Pseudoflavitalea rhizosphaerae]
MMKDFEQLFDGWVEGTLTTEEAAMFLGALKEEHPDFPLLIDKLLQEPLHTGMGTEELRERLYLGIAAKKAVFETPVRKLVRFPVKWAAAAVLVLMAGIAGWWLVSRNKQTEPSEMVVKKGEMPKPGGDKAVLVLSNGKEIFLDSLADGQLAEQQGSLVFKPEEGRIAYRQQQARITETVAFNTLKTPRGGQYRLTLPDGTKVWLNAASSITYPTSFHGKERSVTITGEAYFEVAKVKAKHGPGNLPFKVKVAGLTGEGSNMEIEVLGTHFNINAYVDEPMARTTLLEGSIKLAKGKEQYLMHPGQQAQLEDNGQFRISDNINSEEVLAWKNGYFFFDHADLRTVMRQIARWYDVNIEYRPGVTGMKFGGEISRKANLDEVLKIMEVMKIRFIVEEKKIIVIP